MKIREDIICDRLCWSVQALRVHKYILLLDPPVLGVHFGIAFDLAMLLHGSYSRSPDQPRRPLQHLQSTVIFGNLHKNGVKLDTPVWILVLEHGGNWN
jgi:hypothetical protein